MNLPGTDKKSIFTKRPRLLYIASWCPKPGWMRSLHSHNFCEIMFAKEGSGMFRVGEQDYPFSRGDLIAMNPRTPHSELIFDTPKSEIIFLGVTRLSVEGFAYNSLVNGADFRIVGSGEFYDQLCFYFEQLTAENEMKQPYFTLASDSILSIIIAYILRLTSPDADEIFESKRTYNDVKAYFDDNFATIDSIDNACRSLYINKFYLTHLFKDTLGISPLKYLIKKRVDYAKELLSSTDMSIAEIAKACGYLDTAYFCRVFKKVENATPLSYRKKNKKR